ncbi:MAG: ECF transporter S component [Oscillospiraceae bacterium]|nr:ECF transporter S component [Oscillospiraceae bacterium]MBR1845490.1 ECF transporter S component [Oscillospiraceae bacterium]
MKNQRINTRTLTGVAIFTAIVVVLQLLGSFIRFGQFSISLVLIPIVVGAALYGVGAGAWLGFVFGIAVLLTDSALFFSVNPIGTVITVLVKGALAGWCAGLVFKALEKKNTWLAVIAAAIVCPVVNTGVFVIGCNLFFLDFIKELAANAGFESAGALILFGFVGLNFVFEMLVNIVLSPVILRLIKIGKKG